jgi:hypothetical protein
MPQRASLQGQYGEQGYSKDLILQKQKKFNRKKKMPMPHCK